MLSGPRCSHVGQSTEAVASAIPVPLPHVRVGFLPALELHDMAESQPWRVAERQDWVLGSQDTSCQAGQPTAQGAGGGQESSRAEGGGCGVGPSPGAPWHQPASYF